MNVFNIVSVRNAICLVFLLLSACVSADVNIPNELQDAVNKYYQAEVRGNWAVVYSYRTPKFKRSVMKDEFVKVMAEQSGGWVLQSFDIVEAQIEDNEAILTIEFKEKPPAQFWVGSGMSNKKTIVNKEKSIWVKESGKWLCKQSPSRWHLPYSQ